MLPEKRSYSGQDYNRASRDAALCMLADILLTYHPEEHYAEVVSICDEIGELGYDLSECAYEDNFGMNAQTSQEALFTVGVFGRHAV